MVEQAAVKVFNYGTYSARDFWRLITQPDIQAWKNAPSPRSAVHVVQSLWGLLEWIAQERGSVASRYFDACPEMRYICDMANSAKHRALTKPKKTVEVRLRHSGQLAYNVAGGYGVGTGGYSSIMPLVVLEDGSECELGSIVDKTAAFLEVQLAE